MLSELPYSTKDVSHGLRTHLAMNSTELPNYQTMDTSLWFSIKEALANESYQIDLAWLDVSPLLAKELKDAPMRIVRDLGWGAKFGPEGSSIIGSPSGNPE